MRGSGCFAIVFFLLLVTGCVSQSASPSSHSLDSSVEEPVPQSFSPRVCFGETCFVVEIANTPSAREMGLMSRDFLPENSGMIFLFDSENNHGFWMKNTRIPLDIIWIDSAQKIVDIQTAFPCEADPCTIYYPEGKALSVLEINAGLAEKNHLEKGMLGIFDFN